MELAAATSGKALLVLIGFRITYVLAPIPIYSTQTMMKLLRFYSQVVKSSHMLKAKMMLYSIVNMALL